MTTSQKTSIRSELESNDPLSKGALAYLCANTREQFFTYIHEKLEEAEKFGVSQQDVAFRIGKSKSRLSKLLGAPGNWTLDTVTELMFGICGEEIIPHSLPLLRGKNDNNCSPMDMLNQNIADGRPRVVKVDLNLSAEITLSNVTRTNVFKIESLTPSEISHVQN